MWKFPARTRGDRSFGIEFGSPIGTIPQPVELSSEEQSKVTVQRCESLRELSIRLQHGSKANSKALPLDTLPSRTSGNTDAAIEHVGHYLSGSEMVRVQLVILCLY